MVHILSLLDLAENGAAYLQNNPPHHSIGRCWNSGNFLQTNNVKKEIGMPFRLIYIHMDTEVRGAGLC